MRQPEENRDNHHRAHDRFAHVLLHAGGDLGQESRTAGELHHDLFPRSPAKGFLYGGTDLREPLNALPIVVQADGGADEHDSKGAIFRCEHVLAFPKPTWRTSTSWNIHQV